MCVCVGASHYPNEGPGWRKRFLQDAATTASSEPSGHVRTQNFDAVVAEALRFLEMHLEPLKSLKFLEWKFLQRFLKPWSWRQGFLKLFLKLLVSLVSSGSATSDFDSVDNTSAGGVQLLAQLLKCLECQCQKKRQLPWSWRQSFLKLFLKWLVSLVSLVSPPLILIVLTTPPRRSQSSMARRPLSHCDQNGKIFAAFSHWEGKIPYCAQHCCFFFPPHVFSAEGFTMTVLLGILQAMPFLYRQLRMCIMARPNPSLSSLGAG